MIVAESNGRGRDKSGPYGQYTWRSEEARRAAQALEHANEGEFNLDTIDLSAITPIDALNLLFLMQKKRNRR